MPTRPVSRSGFATCLTETGRPRGCLPLCSPSPHVQRVWLQGTDDPSEVAVDRVLTRSGRWVVRPGVPLMATDSQRVAVIVEPAHPSRIAPLLMSVYGLTA